MTKNSSVLLAIGTKLRPLLRTDFSGSDSGKLLGIVTTASWLSLGGSRLLEGPATLVNFCVLIWYRYWKSLELSCGMIHSDEGLTLETSVFESFTVANLPYRPCG